MQSPSPRASEEHLPTNLKALWRQSPTKLLGYCAYSLVWGKKKQQKPLSHHHCEEAFFHCPCEQVLINLISWVQCVHTAFVSWEVIHVQLPHFPGPLSSTLPLCQSFGKGIRFFPGCSLLWTRGGGVGIAATVWQMTFGNRLNKR